MARTVLTVFLSSTGEDLDAYRAEIRKRIGAIEFLKCVAMEDFGPRDGAAIDVCQKEVVKADLFVGVVGLRRGWEPSGDNKMRSITEMEYDWATAAGRGRFICIAPDDFSIKGSLRDKDEQHDRQVAFRERVSAERVAGMRNFDTPTALAAEVVSALLSHIISGDLIKHVRPDLAGSEISQVQAPIAAAVETLAADEDIDLLALARNPKGFDVAEIESKLRARAEEHEKRGKDERRKSAEYWRHIGALAYLHDLQKAHDAQRRAADLDPDNVEGRYQLGHILFRLGELQEARELFEGVLVQARNASDSLSEASATGSLAELYRTVGEFDRAEELGLRSLTMCETMGRRDGMATEYAGLALIYQDRGDLDQAEEMHLKSLKLYEEIGHNEGVAIQYGNLGSIYQHRKEFDRAEEMHARSLSLYEEMGLNYGIANQSGNIGLIHMQRGDSKRAEEMFMKVLEIDLALGRKKSIATAHTNLGHVYFDKGDNAEACTHWRKARELYAVIGMPHKINDVENAMREAGCEGFKRKVRPPRSNKRKRH